MPYRRKGSSKGKWLTQKTRYIGENNPNYKGLNVCCTYCGKLIYKPPSVLKRNKRVFCSHQCYSTSNLKPDSPYTKLRERTPASEVRGEKHYRWSGDKFCRACGIKLLDISTRRRGYCSKRCSRIYQAKRKRELWLKRHCKVVRKPCEQCGKVFTRTPRTLHSRFCSRACVWQWMTENKSRERSRLWRGGSSYMEYPVVFNLKFRNKIRKRDHYTCQHCSLHYVGHYRSNRALHVHHIDGNKENCVESNLVTLCWSCHRKEHARMRKVA